MLITRSSQPDENLQLARDPFATFLILARYAPRTVFEEQMESISQHGSIFWPRNLIRFLGGLGLFHESGIAAVVLREVPVP